MELWQEVIVAFFGVLGAFGFAQGYFQCKHKKNAFGISHIYRLLGAFVWADCVVLGLFWLPVAGITLLLQDFILFLFILSLFWLVRSIGETLYWLMQQFSPLNRNPVKNFVHLKRVFHNDSIWFVYQLFWQCVTVLTLVTSIYLGALWLK